MQAIYAAPSFSVWNQHSPPPVSTYCGLSSPDRNSEWLWFSQEVSAGISAVRNHCEGAQISPVLGILPMLWCDALVELKQALLCQLLPLASDFPVYSCRPFLVYLLPVAVISP